MNVGVIGASGYAGGELLRLLSNHPKFQISYISAGTNAGELVTAVHPHLSNFERSKFESTDLSRINTCDLVFIALPHGESGKLISQIKDQVRIIDLGADFRLANKQSWEKYYSGDYAGQWIYGLPEIIGATQIAKETRVANPGCYATAISLAIAPVIDLVVAQDLVAVAASGTTGAGRSAKISLIASEVMNSMSSYKFGGVHQHTPEIEECLSKVAKTSVNLSFTPILAPMPRGILATVTSKLNDSISVERIRQIFESFYQTSPFVCLLPQGQMPMTSSVTGTNNAQIQVAIDDHTKRLVVSCVIDNLGKGAAGQAIQNANLICGFEQDLGLTNLAVR
jgi:N-acetyl-gamma-glutamyl-phosphate reductase